jgi:hypothetical protein
VHYQTRLELVKGLLTFKENCMTFEPKKGQKYKDGKSTDDNFFMVIDYQDISEHQKMKIPDEMCAEEDELGSLNRQMYQYNILYQIVVSCVNGLTVGKTTSVKTTTSEL